MKLHLPIGLCCLSVALLGAALAPPSAAAQNKKEYLSPNEAESLRDADTSNDRIELYIGFAADRIKKLQYEFDHPGTTTRPEERINGLILNYTDCLDDGADLLEESSDKNENIRKAIADMQARASEFMVYLKSLQAEGRKMDPYKENLDDAIEATRDAINTADDADKQDAPPPVRRRPQ
jgi:hypothetical protein